MDSTISKLFKLFSNWFVYLLGLLIYGGLFYYLFKVNQVIQVQNISGINDLSAIAISNPEEFFTGLGAALLFLCLTFFIVPISYQKLFKIHIVVPFILIGVNILGYYRGYGLYVFMANIVILVLTVLIITFTVLASIPNNN